MRKTLLILIALTLLILPSSGVCKNWTSGYGYEADNFIKKIARENGILEIHIDYYFFYSVTVMGDHDNILKVVDIEYGDEYYKNINGLPRKNNNTRDNPSNNDRYGYGYGADNSSTEEINLAEEQDKQRYKEFMLRIDAAIDTKDPAEIMIIANELFDNYWWENFTIQSADKYSIEATINDFLYDIANLPDMYDIYTMVITNLTHQRLETLLIGEPFSFVRYVKNDKNANVGNAVQFLEFLLAELPNINFDDDTDRGWSKDSIEQNIKTLEKIKR